MPLSSSKTGRTDLRDTDVQQPNTAAHLSTDSSPLAFSAKSGQLDAGSTTTASNFRPSTPPLAFCCSISISMTSFSVVSLIAMVPESECRIPTLIGPVSAALAGAIIVVLATPSAASVTVAAPSPPRPRRVIAFLFGSIKSVPCPFCFVARLAGLATPARVSATPMPQIREFAPGASAIRWTAIAGYGGRLTSPDQNLTKPGTLAETARLGSDDGHRKTSGPRE